MAHGRQTFRFVHTADLHLDSPLELREDSLINRIGGATRQALARLVDLCIDESVDALLIAGDLFDGEVRTAETLARLNLEMRRLRDADIRVFIIYGNHDRKSGNEKALELPDNVHVFSGRGTPEVWSDKDAVLHGVSFTQRHVSESLLPKYRKAVPGQWNIGLMHTSIDGSEQHDVYAPCSLSALIDHGYDYWALGHIHKRRVHHTNPAVVMPGTPQGRHINEAGACSVSLVTLTEGKAPIVEERAVRVVTFDRLSIDASGALHRNDVLDQIDHALNAYAATTDDTIRVLRLQVHGECEAAYALHDSHEVLTMEVDGLAERYDDIAIERVALSVKPPKTPTEASTQNPLHGLFTDEVLTSSTVEAMIDSEFERLGKLLPASCRSILGSSPDERQALKASLLELGTERVKARLGSGLDDAN